MSGIVSRVQSKCRYPVNQYSKDPDNLHLYVKDIRILTQKEYKHLREAIPKDHYKILFDILMVTGMRFEELLRLYNHKEWYNASKNLIHLPEMAQLKAKRKQLERTVFPLPSMFGYLLKDLWEGPKPPAQTTFNKDLQRWAKLAGMNPYGISVKTSRKTIESWQVVSGILESTVCLRAGHSEVTSMKHYQGLALSEDEKRDIKNQLIEWNFIH